MLSYLIRRVLLALFTCWAISVLAFVIIQLPPGDFVDAYIAQSVGLGQRHLGRAGAAVARRVRARSADLCPVPALDAPDDARRPGHGHGVAAAGHRGHRRPALADDGRLDRRGRPDLDRRPADRHLLRRAAVLAAATTCSRCSASSGWRSRASCSGCWSSTSASSTSTPTSAGCSRRSTSTRPGAGRSSSTCSSTCRCRR